MGVAGSPAVVASRRLHRPGAIRDGHIGALLRLSGFRRVVLVAALILGSHAVRS